MALAAVLSVGLIAQSPEPPVPSKPQAAPAPAAAALQQMPAAQLRVQVTIVRYSGDKKTASLPFTLWVNANDEPTSLNAGQSVPIPSPHFVSGAAASTSTSPISYTFQPVGTRITCQGTPTADGRFKLTLGIRDSYPAPAKTSGDIVSLKSLETHNSLVLRSGQVAEFVASTDMITGEVTRIEVTATVMK
jgi:hypothetical protein